MDVNLNTWFGQHLSLMWLTLVLLLVALELLRRDAWMLSVATGPLAAAGLAVVMPHAWRQQLVVALVVAVIGAIWLRPLLERLRATPTDE